MQNKCFILQRLIPSYRVGCFQRITVENETVTLIIGNDIGGVKARNHNDLSSIRHKMLRASTICFFGRRLVYHHGLLRLLLRERPMTVICEAESHVIGYLKAILYKLFMLNKPKLVLWCFYLLPGQREGFIHKYYKPFVRKFFDGFISYNSFGERYLRSKGECKPIFLSVNVCDTDYFLNFESRPSIISKCDVRKSFRCENKFICMYVGTLDANKKPEFLLDLAEKLDDNFIFLIVGGGAEYGNLENQIRAKSLKNVILTGKVERSLLADYYKASDLVIIPGRGGITISEAQCFGKPVIVHQADGTEYDLIGKTGGGYIVNELEVDKFVSILRHLRSNPILLEELSRSSRRSIDTYNTGAMARAVLECVDDFEVPHESL